MRRALVTFLNPAGDAVPAIEGATLFALDTVQVLPSQPQPGAMAALHWLDDLADLVAIGTALADDPAIADHASHAFDCVAPWRMAADARLDTTTHLTIVMANAVPGRDADYHRWYEDHHTPDVIATPGVAGVWRGRLGETQLEPGIPRPAGYVVLVAAATTDPQAMLAEMAARTLGTSASGVRYAPRSDAVSDDRTIHFFRKL